MTNVKTGKYAGGGEDELPANVRRALAEVEPDWDWWCSGGWVVLRMYSEGRESTRVAAVIKKEVSK